MDRLVWPAFSCGPPSPPSFFAVGHNEALEVQSSCDLPEHWLLGDGVVGKHDDGEELQDAGVYLPPPAPLTDRVRKRGRKHGPSTTAGLAITHVEAERQRRDRLNRRFCDLRAAVPMVSRMDRASLLSDAVAYIAELRGRVEKLEEAAAEAKRTAAAASQSHCPLVDIADQGNMALEARMVGREAAALRLTTTTASHAPARLMAALRALDLPVQHACVCRVGGVTVQDVVVDVPSAELCGEDRLRPALLRGLLQESG
jgi:hypothetical protein